MAKTILTTEEKTVKTTLVIPTYWTFPPNQHPSNRPDAVYDHPTFINTTGTLPKLLKSLEKIREQGADIPDIVVLVAVTHKELEKHAEKIMKSIIEKHKHELNVTPFSTSDLKSIVSKSKNSVFSKFSSFLNLRGYSNIRNIGLVIGQILESDAVVFLDDDELIIDKVFFEKCTEFVGKKYEGKIIGGVTGYYVNPSGHYWLSDKPREWWQTGWRKKRMMNRAFEVIENDARLRDTSFAFGGNMTLHKELFSKTPFDPYITRGEDMDLLVNAKIFGFAFLLDTQLRVLHTPEYVGSRWSEMRQDIYRFAYMRKKLQSAKHIEGTDELPIEALDPYPGYFLKRDLTLRFLISSSLSTLNSVFELNTKEFSKYLENIKIALSDVQRNTERHFTRYFGFQRLWAQTMPLIRGDKPAKDYLENKGIR